MKYSQKNAFFADLFKMIEKAKTPLERTVTIPEKLYQVLYEQFTKNIQVLIENMHLKHLDIGGVGFTGNKITAILSSLQNNKKLHSIDFGYIEIQEDIQAIKNHV